MQTKFKRHQKVRILAIPNPEYVEYHNEDDSDFVEVPIKKGMLGKINIILPNGQYHVEIINEKGEAIAYAPFDEDSLEAIEEN